MIPVINGIEEPVRNQTVSAGLYTAVTEGDVEELTESPNVLIREDLNQGIAAGQCFWRKGI